MNLSKRLHFVVPLLIVFLGFSCTESPTLEQAQKSKFIIEAEELQAIIQSDSVTVLDLRKPEQYALNHLPKAINIWRSEVQSESFPYPGMMGEKHLLESVFGLKGIKSNQYLVMYDDRGGCEATRLWWVLNYYGYDKMAILNGGIKAWRKIDSLTVETNQSVKTTFKLPEELRRNETLITAQELVNRSAQVLVIDTRTKSEFTGDLLKSGAQREGRIPGSVHQDWMVGVDSISHKFKPIKELDSIYSRIIDSTYTDLVTYCHSGVRSAHTFFILTELLGYENVRNFDGSWVEWTYLNLPVAVGSTHQISN